MAIETGRQASRLCRRSGPKPRPALCRARQARPATTSGAIATGSSIPPPSAGSRTRRRCSSITRAITTAPGSPIRWKWRRSPARWRARSGSTRTWPRRWRSRTISAIRRSAMPASARSTKRCGSFGGFDHNAQALRIVTDLERRYAGFDGLNLTWETLEGLVKHNGPLTDRARPRRRPLRRARRAGGDPGLLRKSRTSSCGPSPAPKRRWPRSPTTSPMTRTTSTTACAPICSRSTTSRRCRSSATSVAEIGKQFPELEPAAACTKWCAA